MTDKKKDRCIPAILRIPLTLIQIILYVNIQIIFIPFAIVGMIYGFIKEMHNCRKLGISYSAGQALQYRWIMHYFNVRPDSNSAAFTSKIPTQSPFALWSIMGPLIIAQRLFGFSTKFGRLAEPGYETLESTPGARVYMFDRIMEKYVDKMDQIVFPGSGFDLIAQRFTEGKKVKVFELDQENTMNAKIETLGKAEIKHDWIRYIPVDYKNESWVEALKKAGFDRTAKTLFVWQSVSNFLDADTVKKTLADMAGLCAKDSVIALDLYSKELMLDDNSVAVKSQRKLMAKNGEPWKFGIDMSKDPRARTESLLKECGLKIKEYHLFSEKLDIKPFYCIVEAGVL